MTAHTHTHTYANPMTRCTYVEIGDVPRPSVAATALIRHDEWTALRIHPGSAASQVVQEIVHEHHLRHDEASTWVGGFQFPTDPASVRFFLRDPIGFLLKYAPELLTTPCTPDTVPAPLRIPGARQP